MARFLISIVALIGPPAGAAHAPPCATVLTCRADLVDARRAISWQRSARRRLTAHLRRVHRPEVVEAAQLAARVTGVDPWAMVRVASCESNLDPFAVNPSSGAAGPWQYLPSTWRHTPFASWSPTNPIAAALATALIVRREGWRQWVCQP